MPSTSSKKRFEGFDGRLTGLTVGVTILMGILALRLWDMQIIHGQEYSNQAKNNWVDFELLKAPRGMIFGRDREIVLADNRAACDLVLTPGKVTDPERVCAKLAQLIDIDPDALLSEIERAVKNKVPFKQILVKSDIPRAELNRVEELSFAMQGVYSVARPQRRYYYNQTAGQILGWFNELSEEELSKRKPRYRIGDIIGRAGLEMAYEDVLKGYDGAMIVSRYNGSVPQLFTDNRGVPYIEKDSRGRDLVELEPRKEPVPGGNIFTTLDMGLQRECETILGSDIGAIVVLNSDTGEVLAMASTPGYDPNIFATSSPDRGQLVTQVLDDKMKPSLSRGFQQHYPPGSVFKVALAIAGLEEGIINEHTSFGCNGKFYLPGVSRPWRCWRLKYGGHGGVSVVDALAYSCDVYFYNVGLKLGPEKVVEWSNKLGLGVKTGIDLPNELPGLIPGPEWKRQLAKDRGETEPWQSRWYDGETVNMSIGQGSVVATPLQNAVLMATVLNGGRLVRPYVNMELGPKVSEPIVSENTLRLVQEGMRKCVEKVSAPSGTGKEARIEGLDILGKTGTAQVVRLGVTSQHTKEEDIPYQFRDHALFVSGVTDRTPRIAVSVIIEHGLHGSSAAAPAARKVFEYFYRDQPGGVMPAEPAAPVSLARKDSDE